MCLIRLNLQAYPQSHSLGPANLRDTKTMYRGRIAVDLLENGRPKPGSFQVIKPNDEYGGKGVVLGFEATERHNGCEGHPNRK